MFMVRKLSRTASTPAARCMWRGRPRCAVCAIAVIALAAVVAPSPALAHLPFIIRDSVTVVHDPLVSQAHYGELHGRPHLFVIPPEKRYRFYLQLVLPDLPGIDTALIAEVRFRDTMLLLRGDRSPWKRFFEPFGGDDYLTGPELTRETDDTVWVTISRPTCTGAFAVAFGTAERWGPGEIVHTVGVLPTLKREFFKESPWLAYWNLTGAFLLVTAGVLVAAAYLIAKAH